MKLLSTLFAAALFALASSCASAAPIHALNDQSPHEFSVNNIFSGNARGWEFIAGAANLQVSQLGIATPGSGAFTLSLWDVASRSILAQTVLSNTSAGEWNWVDLSSSVALTQGAHYLIMGIGNDTSQSYYFSNNLPASWYPSGDIQYATALYCNECSANTFPMSSLPGYQYGVVDIGYTVNAADVPEPSSVAIFGLGLLALGVMRRRTKA